MRRRAFLLFSAAGTLLSQLLRPLVAHSAPAKTVAVASLAALNKSGQVLVRTTALGPVLVVRDPASKQLIAVNPTCPHRGCLVAWTGANDSFLCPCHQARFNAKGRWIGGQPVNRPLASYKVTVQNGEILVSKT